MVLSCIHACQKPGSWQGRFHEPKFHEGQRVFLFKPAEKTGPARKFARPFHGPYRIVELDSNTAKICHVDRPEEDAILVALERLQKCPEEVANDFWPPQKMKRKRKNKMNASSRKDGFTTDSQENAPIQEPSPPRGQRLDTQMQESATGVQDSVLIKE